MTPTPPTRGRRPRRLRRRDSRAAAHTREDFVRDILRVHEQRGALDQQLADLYAGAKKQGFDPVEIKVLVKHLRTNGKENDQ